MSRPPRGRRSPRRDPAELRAGTEARLKWEATPLEEKDRALAQHAGDLWEPIYDGPFAAWADWNPGR